MRDGKVMPTLLLPHTKGQSRFLHQSVRTALQCLEEKGRSNGTHSPFDSIVWSESAFFTASKAAGALALALMRPIQQFSLAEIHSLSTVALKETVIITSRNLVQFGMLLLECSSLPCLSLGTPFHSLCIWTSPPSPKQLEFPHH